MVGCLVHEDTAYAEPCGLVLLGPTGVALDLGTGLFVGLVAVVDSDIAHRVHVAVGIQPGYFSGIVLVGERGVTGTTVRIDNDQEF